MTQVQGQTGSNSKSQRELALLQRVRLLEGALESAVTQLSELKDLAYTDPLTRLFNRRALDERLRQELSRCNRLRGTTFTVAVLDVDDFKSVNDALGHLAGDELLKRIAADLRKCLREHDVIFRTGGDEFVALMPDTAHEEALAALERFAAQVSCFDFHGRRARVSFGIATRPPDGETAASLLARADMAMYEAKRHKARIQAG